MCAVLLKHDVMENKTDIWHLICLCVHVWNQHGFDGQSWLKLADVIASIVLHIL